MNTIHDGSIDWQTRRGFRGRVGWLATMSLLVTAPLAQGGISSNPFEGEILTAQGLMNPVVLVGFNPQPEPPPEELTWNLEDPTQPMIGWSNDEDHYMILFGFQPEAGTPPDDTRVTFDTSIQDIPDGNGMFQFGVTVDDLSGVDPQPFHVFFEIMTTEGTFDRASWVGFNPQPEPPGFEGAVIGFEFDAIPASPTAVTLAFSVEDPETGNVASWTLIPEPTSAALLALGAATLLSRRQRIFSLHTVTGS